MTITPEDRKHILKAAKAREACSTQYRIAYRAKGKDFTKVVIRNINWCCANNILPRSTLKVLAEDSAPMTRSCVAMNPSTPQETLKILAGDKESFVRHGVARNPSTPIEILEILKGDEEYVSFAAIKNLSERRSGIILCVHLLKSFWNDLIRRVNF